MLERGDARLRAKAGGIERRCRLGETHRGFGIEAVTEANGKAGIEGMMKRMIPEVKEVVAEAE